MFPWKPLFPMCHGMENSWRNLHILQDIRLILLKFGTWGILWIASPKPTIKFVYDVIITSKLHRSTIIDISVIENVFDVILVQYFSEPQFSCLLRGITTTQNLVQFGLKEAKIGRGIGLPYC